MRNDLLWLICLLSLSGPGCDASMMGGADGGDVTDAFVPDSFASDTSVPDAGHSDAGPSDAGHSDAGASDAGGDGAMPFDVGPGRDAPCLAGEHVAAGGCVPCEPGTFSSTIDAATCEPWTECVAGEQVATAGSAVTDRTCEACARGTFSTEPNLPECVPWTPCGLGDFVLTPGTRTSDQVCTYPSWTTVQFDVAITTDFPDRVLVGPDGAIYVTGYSWSASGAVVRTLGFARRYEPDGTEGWTATVPTRPIEDAILDVDGTLVLLTSGPGSGRIERLDAEGLAVDDVALPFGLGNFGELAADGTSYFACGSNRVSRIARADLTVEWTYEIGPDALAYTVVPDGLGGAFVAGSTSGVVGAGTLGGARDGFLVRVDAAGEAVWARQVGTADSDSVVSAFLEGGDLHLVGSSFAPGGTAHIAVDRYTTAGAFVSRSTALSSDVMRLAHARPDGEGAILVTGTDSAGMFTARIDEARSGYTLLSSHPGEGGDVLRAGRHVYTTFGTNATFVRPVVELVDGVLDVERGVY